jgi:hypothetical protein
LLVTLVCQAKPFPYTVFIETPSSRLAVIGAEAKRKFLDPIYPSLDELVAGTPAVVVRRAR